MSLNKQLSREHEEYVAQQYEGHRSFSSGASIRDKYDVRSEFSFIECKLRGRPGTPAKSTLVRQYDKIRENALEAGREPALALRFFIPDSLSADTNGWVDLAVRALADDADRERYFKLAIEYGFEMNSQIGK
jgi:hypothetical protein